MKYLIIPQVDFVLYAREAALNVYVRYMDFDQNVNGVLKEMLFMKSFFCANKKKEPIYKVETILRRHKSSWSKPSTS